MVLYFSFLEDWKSFEVSLWREMKTFVRERLHLLENVYFYEQNAAYNEAILESICSAAKHVFKEGMTCSTFLETLVNYLYLNKNLDQREWIVEAVTDLHIIRYDQGGDIQTKGYTGKGFGGEVIHKYKNKATDGAFSLKVQKVPLHTLLNM